MSSLHYFLVGLRSPIFNTAAVTSNARTGAKYLKRRLRAPNALQYAVQPPSIKKLAEAKEFQGWEGNAQPGEPGYKTMIPSHMLMPPEIPGVAYAEVERASRPGPRAQRKYASRWIENIDEYVRFSDLDRKQAAGKGAPKKGE